MNFGERYNSLSAKMSELSEVAYDRYGSHSYYAGVLEGLMKCMLLGYATKEDVIQRIDDLIVTLKSAKASKEA